MEQSGETKMSNCNYCESHCNKRPASFSLCSLRIRRNYEYFCNEYLRLFCQKHCFDFTEAKDSWIAGKVGEVVSIGDYTFDMRTIRTDIDHDAPETELLAWWDYSMELSYLDMPSCNYDSWLAGFPRMSEEEILRMKELKANVKQAEEIMKKEIEEYRERFMSSK